MSVTVQIAQDFSLRTVIDALPLSIFWKDRNARYVGCNRFFARSAGLEDADAVAGLSDADLPWAESAERLMEQDQRILMTGEPWRAYDENVATPEGTRVFTRTAKVPLRDAAGTIVGIVGATEWINHTDLAPMEMPDPEERLRALTENAAEAVAVIQDGRIMYVNARGREIFGGDSEDLVGTPVDRVVHPEDMLRVRNDFLQVLSGQEPAFASLYELRIINRQGRVRWLEASTTLVPWEGKTATLHFIIDVTPSHRQRKIQEALNRASAAMVGPLLPEEIYPAVARELASIEFFIHVFTLNADGTLSPSFLGRESVAAELARIFGVSVGAPFSYREGGEFAQVIDGRRTLLITDMRKMLESLLPPELNHKIEQVTTTISVSRFVLAPLADDSSVIGLIALENADVVESDLPAISAFALQMGSALQRARLAQAMARENAERRRAQEERAALEERLQAAQKMEALGRLAGGVAHDFNNILTTITGYADLLLTGLGEDDPRAHEVREILAASRRATSLTRRLLTFSRRQVITPRLVSLNAVIENLHAMLRPLIGEDIQLVYELSPELWPVLADTGQMEQVILNLSVNARDAMRGGGTLTFRTANLRRSAGPPALASEQVVLTVRDTGVGMREEVRAHLFEPFFTTKKAGGGTGLGLATVYGIVEQNQGHIEVSSEPGAGAEFRIFFPRVPGSASHEEEMHSGADLPGGRETILLVEDEQAVRTLTSILLRGWGYSVLEAALPSEAIAIAESNGGSIGLLLTDVVMPGMRGSELAKRILPCCRAATVLFMSGYPDDEGLGLGGWGPGVHFLAKPFTPEALARRVRETLDGS